MSVRNKTMENKSFYTVRISLLLNQVSLISKIKEIAFAEYKCEGIEEFSLNEAQVDEILGERAYSGGDIPDELFDEVEESVCSEDEHVYKLFFYSESVSNAFQQFLQEELSIDSDVIKEDVKDWNAEWRKHYRPLVISESLKVLPEWYKEDGYKDDYSSVYIYPGMGFGTGEHETTFLCLKFLDEICNDESIIKNKCLDFGCGSGILGIAAIKKHWESVEFCDIDKNALDNCLQNLLLNLNEDNLQGHRLVIRDRYQSSKKYDLVFANILENILMIEKDTIYQSLASNGYLIISGLLNDQVDGIVKKYLDFFHDLELVEVKIKGEWSAVLFKKRP